MLLANKVVVVTGASGGIGAETARLFAREGAAVVLMGRNEDKLQLVAQTLEGTQRHSCMPLDVTDTGQVNERIGQVADTYGRIDVLVNNAGFGVFAKAADAPLEQFAEMIDVNYLGTVRCSKAVLPYMLAAGSGQIVNIASIAGKIGTPKSTAYSASKHAVLGFTNSLRLELKGTGVLVSAINPGPVNTPFFDIADPHGSYTNNRMVRMFMIRPEKVAKAVLDAVVRKKRELDIPFFFRFSAKLLQLFPSVFEALTHRLSDKK